MAERQVGDRRAELDLRRVSGERSDERQAVWNVFGEVGQVLTTIPFAVTKPVGENESLAVFAQRLGVSSFQGMDGHDEEAELHEFLRTRAMQCKPAFARQGI
jgi:hypothetical protein